MAGAGARVESALWRALAVFRLLSLTYAAAIIVVNHDSYRHPGGGWAALAAMAAWTALVVPIWLRSAVRRPPPWLLLADLAVSAGLLLSTVVIERPDRIDSGAPTLTLSWVAAPVIACALVWGWRGGGLAAAVVAAAGVLERGDLTQSTFNGVVLLVLAGTVSGFCAELALRAEAAGARAERLQAAARERERLARTVHDGVLQVLALVQRDAVSPELAQAAHEQEAALRELLAHSAAPTPDPMDPSRFGDLSDLCDLRGLVAAAPGVEVSVPAEPVLLPAAAAHELAAAVAAALDNTRRHGGPATRAWVLLDDEGAGGDVVITVRDDGVGFAAGRLEQAAAAGRLGVSASVVGRLRALGGSASVDSRPGGGTEVELRLGRAPGVPAKLRA